MNKVTFSAADELSGSIVVYSTETDCVLGTILDYNFIGYMEVGGDRYMFEGVPHTPIRVQELLEISSKLLDLNMTWIQAE